MQCGFRRRRSEAARRSSLPPVRRTAAKAHRCPSTLRVDVLLTRAVLRRTLLPGPLGKENPGGPRPISERDDVAHEGPTVLSPWDGSAPSTTASASSVAAWSRRSASSSLTADRLEGAASPMRARAATRLLSIRREPSRSSRRLTASPGRSPNRSRSVAGSRRRPRASRRTLLVELPIVGDHISLPTKGKKWAKSSAAHAGSNDEPSTEDRRSQRDLTRWASCLQSAGDVGFRPGGRAAKVVG